MLLGILFAGGALTVGFDLAAGMIVAFMGAELLTVVGLIIFGDLLMYSSIDSSPHRNDYLHLFLPLATVMVVSLWVNHFHFSFRDDPITVPGEDAGGMLFGLSIAFIGLVAVHMVVLGYFIHHDPVNNDTPKATQVMLDHTAITAAVITTLAVNILAWILRERLIFSKKRR